MFSVRLKELRLKHNLSQKELAEILNVSTGTVGNWEVGSREPNFEITLKIAKLFNVSVDYMLGRYSSPTLSRDEDELLTAYRLIGKRLGNEGQRSVVAIAELLAESVKKQ